MERNMVASDQRIGRDMVKRAGTRRLALHEPVRRRRNVLKIDAAVLVGDGDGPKISTFSGRGDLGRWIRVAATREAIGLLRVRVVEVFVGPRLERRLGIAAQDDHTNAAS